MVLHVSVCHRPDLWQLLQQQYYAYGTSCTLFRIIVSNVPGQLQENGMMLLELKQSCANSLCIHISGKCIDPTMDNDYFRNIFIKYLILQIKKSSIICIVYSAKVSDLLHCLPPLLKLLKHSRQLLPVLSLSLLYMYCKFHLKGMCGSVEWTLLVQVKHAMDEWCRK